MKALEGTFNKERALVRASSGHFREGSLLAVVPTPAAASSYQHGSGFWVPTFSVFCLRDGDGVSRYRDLVSTHKYLV